MLAYKDQNNTVDYFPVQSCSWDMSQHCTGNFLVQCWYMQVKPTLYRFFSSENVSVRSGPTLYKYLPSAMLSQTCLDNINWTIFYAMLSQHGRYNIAQVIFLIKVVCLPWANIAQVISLCNLDPERSGHRCRLCNDRWGNDRPTGGRQRIFV